MPKLRIVIDETGDEAEIKHIPQEAWERFKNAAKKQFPEFKDDAWAKFLVEVILACAGGNDELVTYFMTDVPLENATAIHNILSQVGLTWDKFCKYLLIHALSSDTFKVLKYKDDKPGIFIALGVDPIAFKKVEDVAKTDFSNVMAFTFEAFQSGTISFQKIEKPNET